MKSWNSLSEPATLPCKLGADMLWRKLIFYLGEFTKARDHAEAGIAAYDRTEHSFPNWPGGHPGEQCYSWAALAAWVVGFPDQARQLSEEALALTTRKSSQPFFHATALSFATLVHVFRRDAPSAQASAELSMGFCADERIPFWLERGHVVHGWALAVQGEAEAGIVEAVGGVEAFGAFGVKSLTSHMLSLEAEVYAGLGRSDEALSAIGLAFDVMDENRGPWWEGELHRLRGELLLAQSTDHSASAEASFREALDVARRQEARSLELRAATSLARLWAGRGKRAEARDLLAPIYDWFSEGFDTADLKDAKALLDQLH
jgi:tetratricopeptide (TPR) repeat protein